MAKAIKKNNKTIQEAQDAADAIDNATTEKDTSAQVQSVTVRKVNHIQGDANFNPKSNLRTVCTGVWRYISEDPENFDEDYFRSPLAKEFGVKPTDLIYVVGNQTYKIVVV